MGFRSYGWVQGCGVYRDHGRVWDLGVMAGFRDSGAS